MIIGIDLGTTNSLAAYFTEDGPKIIPNRLGERLTPSVVSIEDDGTLYVGRTAKERMQLYPEQSAAVFKRDMGTDRKFSLGGKDYTAEELSSFVLRSLKEDAEAFLGEEVDEAVISVPAYFNDLRRRATKHAGELAGLKVDRIISEPTAAAIAYGLYNDNSSSKNLVFDLGGGTFDVSILDYFPPILEVRAVAGDNFLGGEDFTGLIENRFFKHFPGLDTDKMSGKELAQIHKAADRAKIELSQNDSASVRCVIQGEELEYTITLDEFEHDAEELYERMRIPIKRALSDAGLKLSEIDKVVLVGGATRMPGLRSFIIKLLHSFPRTDINPDEAVALGAAIQGAMKERDAAIREVVLTDVCPFTLGTEISVMFDNGRYEPGHYCPIIERNTVIPASRTEKFYTIRDGQTKIDFDILQGESRIASNNLLLDKITVEVPENKAGLEGAEVTYTYDINSILEVEIKVISTGKKYRQVIKGQHTEMTDEEIDKRFEELSYLKIPPREQEPNRLAMLRAERMYEEYLGEDRRFLEAAIRKFEEALELKDIRIIEDERRKLINLLDSLEGKRY